MTRRIASALVAALLVSSLASSAWAQATRTYVSGVGDDANPCSRTAPCKTFAGAISKTAAFGAISTLDPGGFGPVTITKALTIDGSIGGGSILNSGTSGVNVNVTTPALLGPVILRGIAIQGAGTGTFGVRFIAGKSLVIEDCAITNQLGPAIDFEPAAAGTLSVRHATLTGNAGGGVLVGGLGTATISTSQLFDNDLFGLKAIATSHASIFDSVLSGGSGKGLWAIDTAEINMDHGLISDNVVGVQGDAPIRLSEVMLGHNATGIAGAQVKSCGNNRIASGNTTDGAPGGTIPQQ